MAFFKIYDILIYTNSIPLSALFVWVVAIFSSRKIIGVSSILRSLAFHIYARRKAVEILSLGSGKTFEAENPAFLVDWIRIIQQF